MWLESLGREDLVAVILAVRVAVVIGAAAAHTRLVVAAVPVMWRMV